jgi:hypothetical protein
MVRCLTFATLYIMLGRCAAGESTPSAGSDFLTQRRALPNASTSTAEFNDTDVSSQALVASWSWCRYFQFRVKNSFSFFSSNAEKALSAARTAAQNFGVGIEWTDDEDTSVSGLTGFFFKVGLSASVDCEGYVNAFKSACQNEGLQWGIFGDIMEDGTCIREGQACPQDWECHSNPFNQHCPDFCCGPHACVTDHLGQNPGVCKSL